MSLPTHDERRQTQRHRLGRLASMIPTDGGPPRFCLVTDFSEGGVRVNANGLKIPGRRLLQGRDLQSGLAPRSDRRRQVRQASLADIKRKEHENFGRRPRRGKAVRPPRKDCDWREWNWSKWK
jgi:hypothetical protein